MNQNRVLVVDDEHLISWSLAKTMEDAGYTVETAATGAEATEKFATFRPHLILQDVFLPDANGMDLLEQYKADDEDVIVIMITANAHMDSAVQALKLGAEDYIGKPFNLETVKHTISQALEKKRLKKEVDVFRRGLRKKYDHDTLVGNCPKMIEIFKTIKVCAETDCKTVLVLGESGTGKELVARAIHQHSSRVDEPLIEVNCAAIPENLLENELFGHEKGSYTDASSREKGIFELAEGGTVFLDEIGDMPIAMQAKVLKVIETKRYRRLGGKEDLEANVRIIAATNQNLPKMVEEKRFRGDLFYRLNVMAILLPPLRERMENIPNLVQYFIQRLNEEYGRAVEGVSPKAMEYLLQYEWPGNVRELRNSIERVMMLEQGKTLTSKFLPSEIRKASPEIGDTEEKPAENTPDTPPHRITLPPEGISIGEVEKELIQQALARYGGNQTKAAKCLSMTRDTLRYRMKKFGIDENPGIDADHASVAN
ncbi:MAG: DNA-binding response regulator [Desulfuromonas sp.]|uniref:sigma-54-dependent transcriptional regulator n=1 Tax=Desulfuromonas sp. TaxID=892 RepID=UPI000CC0C554|nr:sigma-54 dependent transcriptional regulator [Desulfuromonas sp.]PLX86532.1 MAG: DNA-binding response regulator [Desulfuromonas sp.]